MHDAAKTDDRWRAELARLEQDPSGRDNGYRTRQEIQDALGVSLYRAMRFLRDMQRQDRLDVKRVPRENLAGAMHREPCYRILPPEDIPTLSSPEE